MYYSEILFINSPSIHLSKFFYNYPTQGHRTLSQGTLGKNWETPWTGCEFITRHNITHTHTNTHLHSTDNLEMTFCLQRMSLEGGGTWCTLRKSPKHTDTIQTHRGNLTHNPLGSRLHTNTLTTWPVCLLSLTLLF